MSERITFIIKVAVNDGASEQLQAYFEKVASTIKAKEPNTLMYTWSFNADKSEAIVIEQYANTMAFFTHSKNVNTAEVAKIATFKEFNICGELPAEVKAQMEKIAANFYTPMQGITKVK